MSFYLEWNQDLWCWLVLVLAFDSLNRSNILRGINLLRENRLRAEVGILCIYSLCPCLNRSFGAYSWGLRTKWYYYVRSTCPRCQSTCDQPFRLGKRTNKTNEKKKKTPKRLGNLEEGETRIPRERGQNLCLLQFNK